MVKKKQEGRQEKKNMLECKKNVMFKYNIQI